MYKLEEEKNIFKQGYFCLAGVDEVGRGSLAGPVVAASVSFFAEHKKVNQKLIGVNDSKKLSPKRREYFFKLINEEFHNIGIGVVDSSKIDRINILQASLLAMKLSINKLTDKPEFILVDGNCKIPELNIAQKSIIKGDGKVFSIAAASIIAKVYRDHIMLGYHKEFPLYGFDRHKGYGTKQHLEAIKKYGALNIHRKSFKPFSLLN